MRGEISIRTLLPVMSSPGNTDEKYEVLNALRTSANSTEHLNLLKSNKKYVFFF